MKVGINARALTTDEPGGAIQTGLSMSRELIDSTRVETLLFGSPSVSTILHSEVDSTLWTDTPMWGLLWERTVLPWQAVNRDIDVLFCPNHNGPLHDIDCPVVVCIHDMGAERGWQSRLQQIYSKTVLPRTARAADAIVTVSEFSKGEIHEILGIPNSKISTVYNGVSEYFLSDGSNTEIDLPKNYILFVGAMNPRKNIRGAVSGFRRFKNHTGAPHELVLIGPSNSIVFEDLEIPRDRDVSYKGFVSREKLKYAYENASAFLFPSLYEGFGIPPLEAMACGTPVVASNTTALPEVLGEAAEYVNPDSTTDIARGIESVLSDDARRLELIDRGTERAREYRWPQVADNLIDVLEEVAGT